MDDLDAHPFDCLCIPCDDRREMATAAHGTHGRDPYCRECMAVSLLHAHDLAVVERALRRIADDPFEPLRRREVACRGLGLRPPARTGGRVLVGWL